jgi:hypothetical protein
MTVKRYRDPAGLLPDRVTIQNDGAKGDTEQIRNLLKANTPQAHIDRLRVYEELKPLADHLQSLLANCNGDPLLLAQIAQEELKALYINAAPHVIRSKKLLAASKKSRGSRMPLLDKWLDGRDLTKTAKELFRLLPSDGDLYRDGEKIIEFNPKGKEKAIGFPSFQRRIQMAKDRKNRTK